MYTQTKAAVPPGIDCISRSTYLTDQATTLSILSFADLNMAEQGRSYRASPPDSDAERRALERYVAAMRFVEEVCRAVERDLDGEDDEARR